MTQTLRVNALANSVPTGQTFACSRSGSAYRFNSSGVLVAAVADTIRHDHDVNGSPLGWLSEATRTNYQLHCRDWTDVAYSATNITPAKDATGLDGVTNSASTLTATGAAGTITQTITLGSADRCFSVWMKRKTGSGTIEITDNNFTNVTDVTADINSSTWTKVGQINRTQANPVIGVRIATSGDEVEVDFGHVEAGVGTTSPILTAGASAARNADFISTSDMGFYNLAAGTWYVKFRPGLVIGALITTPYILTGSTMTDLMRTRTSKALEVLYASDGANSGLRSTGASALTAETIHEAAVSIQQDEYLLSVDGSPNPADNTLDIDTNGPTLLRVGGSNTGASQINGHIQDLRYFDEVLDVGDISQGIFPVGGSRSGPGLAFGIFGQMGS